MSTSQLYALFTQRLRRNLHIVLCFSPLGNNLRKWMRQFPAIINCCQCVRGPAMFACLGRGDGMRHGFLFVRGWDPWCLGGVEAGSVAPFPQKTVLLVSIPWLQPNWLGGCGIRVCVCSVDWFQSWPTEALMSTATSMLSDPVLSLSPELCAALAQLCVTVHEDATVLTRRYLLSTRRATYVTPSSFTELIVVYKRLLSEKMRVVIDECNRFNSGVNKLDATAESVSRMKLEVGFRSAGLFCAENAPPPPPTHPPNKLASGRHKRCALFSGLAMFCVACSWSSCSPHCVRTPWRPKLSWRRWTRRVRRSSPFGPSWRRWVAC
jgi:hypothetical protein